MQMRTSEKSQCSCLYLLLISGDLGPSGHRTGIGDPSKSKMHVENKSHTNAHQPLTSHSITEVTIPPLSAIAKTCSIYAAICALLLLLSP
jgi:hypothetical protein